MIETEMIEKPKGKVKDAEVRLSELQQRSAIIHVKGTSPLICHNFSKKSKDEMRGKQTGQAKKNAGREPKNPQKDFEGSLYPLPDGGYGFPSAAFGKAFVRAGTYEGYAMTYLRGVLFVEGQYVRIEGSTPVMREDIVRLNGKVPDLRYRGEFDSWSTRVPITYDGNAISLSQVLSLFKRAGFSVGVGEWRPEHDGQYGRFSVVGAEDVQ